MKPLRSLLLALCLTPASLFAASVPAGSDLVNFKDLDASSLRTENGAQVEVAQEAGSPALKFSFPAGNSYPGVDIPGPWDLSASSGVSMDVTNTGSSKVGLTLRADNAGDWQKSPWNSEVVWLAPGASGTVTVTFGQSFGKPGYALDPAAVIRLKVFVNAPKSDGEILIQNIRSVSK